MMRQAAFGHSGNSFWQPLFLRRKDTPGLARTHGTGRQAKKHGAITRRPPVAALVNPQLPACHTRLAVRLLFKAGPASTKFIPTPNQRQIPTPLAPADRTASKLAAAGPIFNSRPMASKTSSGHVLRAGGGREAEARGRSLLRF